MYVAVTCTTTLIHRCHRAFSTVVPNRQVEAVSFQGPLFVELGIRRAHSVSQDPSLGIHGVQLSVQQGT